MSPETIVYLHVKVEHHIIVLLLRDAIVKHISYIYNKGSSLARRRRIFFRPKLVMLHHGSTAKNKYVVKKHEDASVTSREWKWGLW